MPPMKIKDPKPRSVAAENKHPRGVKRREVPVGKAKRRT